MSAQQRGRSAKTMRRWLPNQHGAWAMLIVPFVTAVVWRDKNGLPLQAWLIPLAVTELSAFFGFTALGNWLHAPARRRHEFQAPLISYAVVVAFGASLVLLLGATQLMWWLPLAAPLLIWAIWQAAHKKDRSISSGLATVGLAVGVGVAICVADPRGFLSWPTQTWSAIAIFGALFGYFGGTVWHVKSLIRERGNPRARLWSIGWHAVWIALSGAAAAAQLVGHGWMLFFAICCLRTWWLSDPRRSRTLKPAQIGMVEIALSAAALVLAII